MSCDLAFIDVLAHFWKSLAITLGWFFLALIFGRSIQVTVNSLFFNGRQKESSSDAPVE